MGEGYTMLIINPGSTSTKVAVYRGTRELCFHEVTHDWSRLEQFPSIADQEEYRYECILEALQDDADLLDDLSAVVARGGLLHPIESGVYRIHEDMLEDLRSARYGEHASNLGALTAQRFCSRYHVPGFIADPVVVDELCDEARLSGMPELERRSIFHALNHKSAARRAADELGMPYEAVSLIVAHLGGGISVGVHLQGRVVDVNNALDGDGPFSPERSGGVPAGQLAALTASQQYTLPEIQKKICGKGGVFAYLGTKSMIETARRAAEGDHLADLVLRSMAYQVSKEICSLAAVLCGKVDSVVLTGGASQLKELTDEIIRRVSFLAPVQIIPGEREMVALAENGLRVLTGKAEPGNYRKRP